MRSRHAVILDRREGIHAFSVSSHSRPEGVNPRVLGKQSFSTGGSESMRSLHAVILDRSVVNPYVLVMRSFSTGGSESMRSLHAVILGAKRRESMRSRHAEGLCPEASSYGLLRFIAYKSYVVAEVFMDTREF